MTTNEIQAVCCKCGSGLKYPVTIGNKVYGSTCASKHLGINKIPDQWTGNYDDLKKAKAAMKEERDAKSKILRAEWTKKKAQINEWIEKYRPHAQRLHDAFCKAQGSWEQSFVVSISRQSGLPILGDMRLWGEGQYKYDGWDCEPRGLGELSDKQLEILNRIAKN